MYETPKREPVQDVIADDDDDDDVHYDDGFVKKEANKYGRESVGSVVSPYLMPYV